MTPSTSVLTDVLPKGIDWADGLSGRIGTPLPSNAISVENSQGGTTLDTVSIEELPDSPELEIAEQGTCRHRYTMPYNTALLFSQIYARGSLVQDSYGNQFRVLSTQTQRTEPNQAIFTVVSESLSFATPPDEFECSPVELGIDILKHPRYFFALMPTSLIPNYSGTQDTPAQASCKMAIVRMLQAYRDNPLVTPQANIASVVGQIHETIHSVIKSNPKAATFTLPNPNYVAGYKATQPPPVGTTFSGSLYPPTATANGQPNPQYYYLNFDPSQDPNGSVALAFAAAEELLGKLWRQEDNPPLTGWEIRWSSFYYIPPFINPGGYIENPFYSPTLFPSGFKNNNITIPVHVAVPSLPAYFYSETWPPETSTATIFDKIGAFNPQCYSANGQIGINNTQLVCLRCADQVTYQRTWFKVTRVWRISAYGQWDSDILSSGARPTTPAQYRPLWVPT
jgi:hypothetical protein